VDEPLRTLLEAVQRRARKKAKKKEGDRDYILGARARQGTAVLTKEV